MIIKKPIDLTAEILRLLRRCDAASIRGARLRIAKEFQHEEATVLNGITNSIEIALKFLPELSLTGASKKGATIGGEPIILREIGAMLADESFLPSKSDLLALAIGLLKIEIPSRIEAASKNRIIAWILSNLRKKPARSRQNTYSRLRKIYFSGRSSNLSDWASIFETRD